jgi:hypothetical protein
MKSFGWWVRELLWFSPELLLLSAGSRGRGPFRNPEEGERLPLETAAKQTAREDWEDFMCAVVTVIFGVCESDYQSNLRL